MNTLAVAVISHLRLLFDILSVLTKCGGTFSVREARDACAELLPRLGCSVSWGCALAARAAGLPGKFQDSLLLSIHLF